MTCTADVLAQLVALLDGTAADQTGECPNLAAYRVQIVRCGEGWDVELWAEVCEAHEVEVQRRDDYANSIRLRT